MYYHEKMLSCTRVVGLPGQAPAEMNDEKLRDRKWEESRNRRSLEQRPFGVVPKSLFHTPFRGHMRKIGSTI